MRWDDRGGSLNKSLCFGVDGTFTAFNLLVIVAVLSSAAKIPFPVEIIFFDIEYISLINYSRAFIPGNSFPSRNSKKAPPAVETKLKYFVNPKLFSAATVSPPPTTE